MKAHAQLYADALAADAAFQAELERVYGKRKAADARYQYQHDDARVLAARARKYKADEALRASFERERTAANPARRRRKPPKKRATKKRATRKRNPITKPLYVAKYDNGQRVEFRAADDATAVKYATGLGRARAKAKTCLSCKAAQKKTPRRRAST